MGKDGALVPGVMLLLGVLAVQWLVVLPSRWSSVTLAIVALGLIWRGGPLRALAWCLLGIAWACWRGSVGMDARLPRNLEGQDVRVAGQVVSLPMSRDDATGFLLSVDQATLNNAPLALHGRVRVSWYNGAPEVAPCSRWQLTLRLRRPR